MLQFSANMLDGKKSQLNEASISCLTFAANFAKLLIIEEKTQKTTMTNDCVVNAH